MHERMMASATTMSIVTPAQLDGCPTDDAARQPARQPPASHQRGNHDAVCGTVNHRVVFEGMRDYGVVSLQPAAT